ncbi:MAG: hypothetical protein KTR33_06765, partial [Gammaproteobacteria bacterium]|nr:hypothetical protein [Gammaproteobacteria bacterium]
MSTNPTQSVVIPVARCDDTAAPARQLIISGFHRSGTSLTTQALFNAGLVLGEKLVAPSPANPDGHFEDQDIVRLHDDILHSQHRTWYSTGQPNTPDPDQFQTRTDDIIQRYQRNRAATIWGFKDPRTCLFLDWWHNSLPNPAAVLIYRDYWSCYESLRHRQAQQIAHNPVFHKQSTFFWTDPLLPLQLWLDHNQALLNYAQRNPETSLIVSHQAIIEGFDLVRECNQRFALDLAPDQPTGIRKDNNRQRAPVRFSNNIPEELQRQLDNTQA